MTRLPNEDRKYRKAYSRDNTSDMAISITRDRGTSTDPRATTTVPEKPRAREHTALCWDKRPLPWTASRLLADHGSHSPNGPAASRNADDRVVKVAASTGKRCPDASRALRAKQARESKIAMNGIRLLGCGTVTDWSSTASQNMMSAVSRNAGIPPHASMETSARGRMSRAKRKPRSFSVQTRLPDDSPRIHRTALKPMNEYAMKSSMDI